MDFSDDELLRGLEAALEAQQNGRAEFRVEGMEQPRSWAMLKQFVNSGWVQGEGNYGGDGELSVFQRPRLTPAGGQMLTDLRLATETEGAEVPSNPAQAWHALSEVVDPYSPDDRRVREESAALEERGMWRSGISIRRAMELAYELGYRWSGAEQRFVLRDSAEKESARETGDVVAVAELRAVEVAIQAVNTIQDAGELDKLDNDDRAQVLAELATVEAQRRAPRPSRRILRGALGSIGRICEGVVAGGLLLELQRALAAVGVHLS